MEIFLDDVMLPFVLAGILSIVYGILPELLLGDVKEKEETEQPSSFLAYLVAVLGVPEYGLARIAGVKQFSESADAVKAWLGTMLMFLSVGAYYSWLRFTEWGWLTFFGDALIIGAAFQILIRTWAVVRLVKLYRLRARITSMEVESVQALEQISELLEQEAAWKEQNSKLEIKLEAVESRNSQIALFVKNRHKNVTDHIESEQVKLRSVAANISALREWAKTDNELAIDTNILMEADDYFFEELKAFRLLVSKKVQDEWDKNKKYGDVETRKKAIRARDRLEILQKEAAGLDFTVKKWDASFMKNHNLMIGKADEEIIGDYLYEYKRGRKLAVLSADKMFRISASVHMPVIKLESIQLFGGTAGSNRQVAG